MRRARGAGVMLSCLIAAVSAHAWSVHVTAGERRLFLHVGNGNSSGFADDADPAFATGGVVNRVQATVPAALLGTGTSLPMVSDGTQAYSLYGDGHLACADPASQVLIGAGYRSNGAGAATATLSVMAPSDLANADGDTIPVTEISWTVSAPGGGTHDAMSDGVFAGGVQTLATVPANAYIESCHRFGYANRELYAPGEYDARVLYTLTAP